MRDPDGFLERQGALLVRRLLHPFDSHSFLSTPAARDLVNRGRLVDFSLAEAGDMEIDRIAFVTAPFEWCDEQLRQAAFLTLDISTSLLSHSHELKDASAWNVIFNGCRPLFCDHLSFRPIAHRQWWAFGQFFRHFSFPLAVSAVTGLNTARSFRLSRDGLSGADTRRILGMRRFATRLWPVLANGDSGAASTSWSGRAEATASGAKSHHTHLYKYCRWSLPSGQIPRTSPSPWLDYTTQRQHYPAQSQSAKTAAVDAWLEACRPAWVIDVGANTGEFTFMAAGRGAKVIAVEQDPACVTALFQRANGDSSIFPVLANLADLCGGGGWLGSEYSSLQVRLRGAAQLVLVLAVLHHLAISESIPLGRIADFVFEITTRHAIVELIPEDDPMVLRLCAQRERSPHEFSLSAQLAAFSRHFDVISTKLMGDSQRQLLLLTRRTP